MNEKFSIPGAIVIAGVVIAIAIVFTRVPVRSPQETPGKTETSPGTETPGGTAAPKIVVRPVDATRDHIRGNVNAPITFVEYSDTECPFCKQFHTTLQKAVKEHDGKVRWVYRHFPLDALHSKARKEAEATECAGEQGKFWEYTDRIFVVTPSNDGLSPEQLPNIAKDVGLDTAAFEQCLSSGKYAQRVQEDLDDAIQSGGQGTPYTVILGPNDVTIPFSGAQPYENVQKVIETLAKS